MSEIFLDQINAEAVKEEWENTGSRRLKRDLIKAGYEHQISFYGVLTNSETDESKFSRIEVLSNIKYDGNLVLLLHDFFKELRPEIPYSIWVYNDQEGGIALRGRYY